MYVVWTTNSSIYTFMNLYLKSRLLGLDLVQLARLVWCACDVLECPVCCSLV